eukprot:1158020-Pelagomonas_calceolata.AAC.2
MSAGLACEMLKENVVPNTVAAVQRASILLSHAGFTSLTFTVLCWLPCWLHRPKSTSSSCLPHRPQSNLLCWLHRRHSTSSGCRPYKPQYYSPASLTGLTLLPLAAGLTGPNSVSAGLTGLNSTFPCCLHSPQLLWLPASEASMPNFLAVGFTGLKYTASPCLHRP